MHLFPEREFSNYMATEKERLHSLYFIWRDPDNSSFAFPMLQPVVKQYDQDDPSNKPYWYGSLIFFDSAFILADFSNSFFAVFSFLLLKTKIISKPVQGYIAVSESDSVS